MKKITLLLSSALIAGSSLVSFAGNKCEVIIPGDHTPKHFAIPSNVTAEDYLPRTVIFKVKPSYRQNCKVNSIDNILPVQDFLNSVGATNFKKIYPHHEAPAQERNMLGQKMVDLSLIYSFKYTSDYKLEKVINGMLSLGYFEYAEPWYVPKIVGCVPSEAVGSQYHLNGNVTGSINVRNTAWCLTNGSTSIFVGIVDTGTEPTHPDLAPNYAGGYDCGMNDNDPTWQGNNHGCAVSGDACAATDNGLGVASPGFNTKFKAAKGADASGSLVAVYPGIVWCADNGCQIINCSWGGPGGGSYGQSIIDYAAINKNCLMIASAGNGGVEETLYPSSYNNVYRVASSTSSDAMSSFSSYGLDVDYAAPGSNIYSTVNGTGYGQMSGTSMAAPVSAGAAALVQAQFNYTSAFQIGEKLKQTCDPMSGSSQYNAGKLGKGRIDVNSALTQAAKSILVNPITIIDGNDNIFMPGENLSISGLYTNYLDPSSSAAAATLTVVSGPGTITQGNCAIGALATLGTFNQSVPFTVAVSGTAPVNSIIKCRVRITDGTFTGDTYFDVTVNVDYLNITINDVFTTVTSKGRIGYNNDGQAQGLGFEYQIPSPQPLLYESSLMIGTSSSKVSDMFREAAAGNTDFGSVTRVYQVSPAVVSDFDADGKFNDAPSASGALPVEVHHGAYAWATAPYRKFVIFKYVIKNTSGSTLSNLYAGIMSDWDVPNANAGQNKAAWDATNNMGYVNQVGANVYAATKLLTQGGVTHYVVDNIAGGNGGVDPTTSFSTSSKYTVLSTNRNADGFTATGGDVMNCVSNGPFTINAGDSVIVAFALIGGDNLADLQNSACYAQQKWDNTGPCALGINDVTADNLWLEVYPNPTSGNTNLVYNVIGENNSSLKIMNSIGETVMTFNNLPAGKHTLPIDASKLSAGNYFCQMKAGEAVMTKKFSVVK